MRKHILVALLFSISLLKAAAQKSEVSVNTLTGTANVVIPVYSLSRGAVTMPINLIYSATGIKPKDVEMNAGMGWNLQAGGAITRLVRGIPDDILVDMGLSAKVGWIYNTGVQSSISGFTIHNSGDGDCTGQGQDILEISSTFIYQNDTEPDVFNVNAPGLSCQLVYDQSSSQFKTIPYMDLKIGYITNVNDGSAASGQITSFTITNDQGIQYVFDVAEPTIQKTLPSSGTTTGTYNQNYYQQFQNGIAYYDAWYLSKVTDANGNGVTLSYTDYPQRTGQDELILYGGASGISTNPYPQYITQTTVTPKVLTTIQTIDHNGSNQVLTFTWSTNSPGGGNTSTGQSVVNSINGAGKSLVFVYSPIAYVTGGSSNYYRYFLREFIDASTGVSCATPVDYKFGYYGEDLTTNTTILSDSTSTKHIDYWGYYTSSTGDNTVTDLFVDPTNTTQQRYVIPQTSSVGSAYTVFLAGSGANRYPDPANIMAGSLQKVTYAQGGNTVLTYESNDFYDPLSNATNQGGGIRIKTIVDNDNVTGATVTRNYVYTDPATGFSSGKPISLPTYGFATAYQGSATGTSYWNYGTMRSNIDLSQEDHTVMYTNVVVSQTGAGSTVYKYYVPATNWDNLGIPICTGCGPEWHPTTVYSAVPSCSGSFGPPKNDIDTYPFAPNPNYDFERGILQSVTTYNEATTPQKTSETDFTYVRTNTPYTIPAFKYEWNGLNATIHTMSYARYMIYYGTSELTQTATKTVYDSQTASIPQTTTTNSTYGPTYHKLAQQAVTNSDGSLLTSNYSYTKDYTGLSSGNSNPNIDAIYHLQQLNMNIPVESYTTVTPPGGTASVTGASLTLFNHFPTPTSTLLYLPSNQFKFVQPNGGGTFNPMTISGSTLTTDSRYIPVANYRQYDFTGVMQTADDAHKHVQGAVLDHNTYHPVVGVQNAAAYEIAFQDFDSDMVAPWTSDSTGTFTGVQPSGSHTGVAHGMSNGETFTYTIQKNTLASNYIFSIWLNPGASGTFNFAMNPVSPTTGMPTSASKTFSNTSATWQYFEWVLPMPTTGGTGNTVAITASLSTTANIAMDDIIIYPQTASVNTGAFDQLTYYKTAQTNTNGVSSYATVDQWGRPMLQFDQDRNITQKKSYVTPGLTSSFPQPSFWSAPAATPYNPIYPTTPVTFYPTTYSSCYNEGLTYKWDFGDGTTIGPTSSSDPVTHTFGTVYTTAHSYPVVLTVTSPTFTIVPFTQNIIVSPPPPPTVALTYENYTDSNGEITTVQFKQGGVIIYAFTGDQLEAGQNIAQGTYDITVNIAGGTNYDPVSGSGYASITAGGDCRNFVSTNHYTFSAVDLTTATSFDFVTSEFTCP